MKKFGKSLYAAALAALVLASCSKEPVETMRPHPNGKLEVMFGSNIFTQPSSSSRANNNSWNNLDGIGMYMLNSGMQLDEPNAIIEGNSNRHFQVRPDAADPTVGKINPVNNDNVIYYPLEAPTDMLKFMAYYPYTADVEADYTFPVDITDNTPLITASLDNQSWYDYKEHDVPDPINLEFKHKMSRIKIDITPGEGFSYADLSGVTITFRNGNATGTFSLADDAFDESTFSVGNADFSIVRDTESQTMTAYLVMIPNTSDIENRVIVFEHANTTGGGNTYELEHAIPADKHFAEAMEYTYEAEITRTAVNVEEGEILEWDFLGNLMGDDQGPRPEPDFNVIAQSLLDPNCYIWPAGATELRIPVVKAYGMWLYGDRMGSESNTNLLNVATEAYVIWADTTTLRYYSFDIEEPFEGAYLSEIVITYDEAAGNAANGGKQAPINMVVGLRNLAAAQLEFLWSWHVWVTDGDPEEDWEQRKNYNGMYTYWFMDRNLGAQSAVVGDPGSKGFYYQLGRKDPFVGRIGWNEDWTKMYQMINGVPSTSWTPANHEGLPKEDGDVRYDNPGGTVKKPWFWANKRWWNTENAMSDDEVQRLWGYAGSDKSSYDPCPEGWRVPGPSRLNGGNREDSPWYIPGIHTDDNSKPISLVTSIPRQDEDHGVVFDGNGTAMGSLAGYYALGYYPFAGKRGNQAAADDFGSRGYYGWANAYRMNINGDNFNSNEGRENSESAYVIRCAKWEEGQH